MLRGGAFLPAIVACSCLGLPSVGLQHLSSVGQIFPRKQKRAFTVVAFARRSARGKRGTNLNFKPPIDWRSTYDLIVELRADRTAVVDDLAVRSFAADANEEDRTYQSLVSLMLSSQTRDSVNIATMKRLLSNPSGLSAASIMKMEEDELEDLIRSVSFYRRKVQYIKQATRKIVEEHDGLVPDNLEALLELPGVGPKMSIILLRVAFGQVVGISVDTHVHRIANQLGWAGEEGTKQPEQTRKVLESWMPRELWPDVNMLLVGLGQEVQTQKAKLLTKCIECSNPQRALQLAGQLGVNVEKEVTKAGLMIPSGFVQSSSDSSKVSEG